MVSIYNPMYIKRYINIIDTVPIMYTENQQNPISQTKMAVRNQFSATILVWLNGC